MKQVLIVLLVFLTGSFYAQAQDSLVTARLNLRNSSVYLQQLQLTSISSQRLSGINSSTGNVTIIQQIGDNNSVKTNTVSGVSTINYLQMGDSNSIESYNSVDNITESIIQKGDENSVLNYSFGTIDNASLNLIQEGNNLSFEKFGTNSQTNNLTFRLTGDNRTVIIRSY